jgi:uncharacterized protein
MQSLEEIADVLAGLEKLMQREPPLAAVLPRQPGTKESRYAHLLSGSVEAIALPAAEPATGTEASLCDERIAQLESSLAELRDEVAALRQRIDNLIG